MIRKKKIDNVIKWIQDFLNDSASGESVFLFALMIYLSGEVLTTTMFPMPDKIYDLIRVLALALIFLKIILFDRYQKWELLGIILLVGTTLLVYVSSGYTAPFMWALLLVGAKDVSFTKILKMYFAVSLTIVVLAFAASLLGVIENLQYVLESSGRGIRNSFGIVYTTDFAAHVFFLMLTFFYLKRNQLKPGHFVFCGLTAAFVYKFCNARLDVSCMLLAILGFGVLRYRQKAYCSLRQKYHSHSVLKKYGMYGMPLAAIIMIFLTEQYSYDRPLTVWLNELISYRLSLGKTGLDTYRIKPFGQFIQMVGWGGSTELSGNYFFIDCSYLHILLRYGVLFLIAVLLVYMISCGKYRENAYFIMAVLLVTLNCMIAHHLIDLAYNPFSLAVLASCSERKGNRPQSNTEGSTFRKMRNGE